MKIGSSGFIAWPAPILSVNDLASTEAGSAAASPSAARPNASSFTFLPSDMLFFSL